MKPIILFIIFILLIITSPAFADSDTITSTPGARNNISDSILGIWSNERDGFKEINIMFYETGRGILAAGSSATYFGWSMLKNGAFSLNWYKKPPPKISIRYDALKKTITLENTNNKQGHKEIYRRTNSPVPKDPIVTLREEEKKRKIQRRNKFNNTHDIRTETNIQLAMLEQLYKTEAAKKDDFGFGVFTDNVPEPSTISIVKKNGSFTMFIRFGDAKDEFAPRKAQQARLYDKKPAVDYPERIYMSYENEQKVKSLLKSNSIPYKSIQHQIDFFDGYKTGYQNLIIVKLSENDINKIIFKVFSLVSGEHGKVNIRITRKR